MEKYFMFFGTWRLCRGTSHKMNVADNVMPSFSTIRHFCARLLFCLSFSLSREKGAGFTCRNVDGQPSLWWQAQCHKVDKARLVTFQAKRNRIVYVHNSPGNVWSTENICQLRRLQKRSGSRSDHGLVTNGSQRCVRDPCQ